MPFFSLWASDLYIPQRFCDLGPMWYKQYHWRKSINSSVHILPNGKGEKQEKTGKWVFCQRAHQHVQQACEL